MYRSDEKTNKIKNNSNRYSFIQSISKVLILKEKSIIYLALIT
jgi:hypothetical protein